jgi:hypothetical protein
MYRDISAQANNLLGFNYKPSRQEILKAMRSEGGLSAASLQASLATSGRAREAVRKSYFGTPAGGQSQYLYGAFSDRGGQLNKNQQTSLALQQSGLQNSTIGARLQGQLDQALQRMQKVFQGTLAQPNLSLGSAGLEATSLRPQQEPDLPA